MPWELQRGGAGCCRAEGEWLRGRQAGRHQAGRTSGQQERSCASPRRHGPENSLRAAGSGREPFRSATPAPAAPLQVFPQGRCPPRPSFPPAVEAAAPLKDAGPLRCLPRKQPLDGRAKAPPRNPPAGTGRPTRWPPVRLPMGAKPGGSAFTRMSPSPPPVRLRTASGFPGLTAPRCPPGCRLFPPPPQMVGAAPSEALQASRGRQFRRPIPEAGSAARPPPQPCRWTPGEAAGSRALRTPTLASLGPALHRLLRGELALLCTPRLGLHFPDPCWALEKSWKWEPFQPRSVPHIIISILYYTSEITL